MQTPKQQTYQDCEYFLLYGAVLGLIAPALLFGLLDCTFDNQTIMWTDPLKGLTVFTILLMQLPVVIVGRALALPVESGGAAFILFNLSQLGYILLSLNSMLVGIAFADFIRTCHYINSAWKR